MELKKSESLEIRIPYPTKQAFMAKCRGDGLSASEALRTLIDRDLRGGAPRYRKTLRIAVGALIAAAVGAVALPTLAHPSLGDEFRRMDLNGDGQVSFQEYARYHDAIAHIRPR